MESDQPSVCLPLGAQRMRGALADVGRGYDPDAPPGLRKVTLTR